MTEKEKRFAIIGGTVILAVLLFLFFTGRGRAIVNGASDWDLPPLNLPSAGNIIIEGSGPIVIPGLGTGRDLQMIGSCCMDCSAPSLGSNGPRPAGTTFVYNAAAQGPSIYNYRYETVSAPSYYDGGFVGIVGGR